MTQAPASTANPGRLLAEIADNLDHPVPAEWAEAMGVVPRHAFLPGRLWLRDGHGGYTPCDRDAEPARWWEAAYSDAPLVTQLRVDEGGFQEPTSSASAPGTVVRMLEYANIRDDHRVLEVGTGTGYHAALLSHRLGEQQVASIEVDEQLAAQARANLAACGYVPTVVTGDGSRGWLDDAPYDRIICTCSVRDIPTAWMEQTRPGARIVTPWSTSWITYGTLTLTRHDDGASGQFAPHGAYMVMRGQRADADLHEDVYRPEHRPDETHTSVSPWDVAGSDYDAQLAVGLRVSDVWHSWDTQPEDDDAQVRLWLANDDATSWAAVDYDGQQSTRFRVLQHGPRRLWDEIETAHQQWTQAGRPSIEQHRLDITADGAAQLHTD